MSGVPGGTAPVVVGVTGAGENTAALRYAVEESRSHGRGIVLAHAVHEVVPLPPPAMLVEPLPWQQIGQTVVGEVEHELREIAPGDDLVLAREIRPGPSGAVLVDLSDDASLIVLQHRSLSRLHRLFTGSTVVATAAHSRCPVVSVPADWEVAPRPGRVVVGVHEDGTPDAVLDAAFGEAVQHGWSVHLVHAWRLDAVYDDLVAPAAPAWDRAVTEAMEAAVQPFTESYPSVSVELKVRHEWTADALLGLAGESALLVVGRHGSLRHLPHRIGSVARALVSHAPCPVMVVPV